MKCASCGGNLILNKATDTMKCECCGNVYRYDYNSDNLQKCDEEPGNWVSFSVTANKKSSSWEYYKLEDAETGEELYRIPLQTGGQISVKIEDDSARIRVTSNVFVTKVVVTANAGDMFSIDAGMFGFKVNHIGNTLQDDDGDYVPADDDDDDDDVSVYDDDDD